MGVGRPWCWEVQVGHAVLQCRQKPGVLKRTETQRWHVCVVQPWCSEEQMGWQWVAAVLRYVGPASIKCSYVTP